MKVTAIRREKNMQDGTGVFRVIIDYHISEDRPRTATMFYDIFTGESTFEDASQARAHISAAEALYEIAAAYMTLVYYGLEH